MIRLWWIGIAIGAPEKGGPMKAPLEGEAAVRQSRLQQQWTAI